MSLGQLCNRVVVVTTRGTGMDEAARLMREHHVGSLVVVDETALGRKPVGIVTDRDIVIEVVAAGVAPASVTVGDVMGPELVTARESDEPWDTIQRMRAKGVRRVPVVDGEGVLIGIVTVDDLVETVAEQLEGLVKVIGQEQAREARTRK
ncbi:MAG: CBS domain-containing protein [Burkholderiales bacterium]|nr:CBS domain-containing protein [Burkholderiales bacterium]